MIGVISVTDPDPEHPERTQPYAVTFLAILALG